MVRVGQCVHTDLPTHSAGVTRILEPSPGTLTRTTSRDSAPALGFLLRVTQVNTRARAQKSPAIPLSTSFLAAVERVWKVRQGKRCKTTGQGKRSIADYHIRTRVKRIIPRA